MKDSIPWSVALQDRSVFRSLVVDLVLLALFITQHSLLAWSPVKQTLQSVLGVLSRTAYCFTTALALQVLVSKIHLPFKCFFFFFSVFNYRLILTGFNTLLAACDWRPLSVVSASCALEYLFSSVVLFAALHLLGNHLQYHHNL